MTDLEDRLSAREETLGTGIEFRLAAREAELSKTENAGSAFFDTVGTSFLNNFLQLPGVAFEGLNSFSNQTMPGRELPEEMRDTFKPAADFFRSPAFSVEGIGAAARSLPEFLPQRPVDQPGVENPVPPFTERFSNRFDEELTRINAEEDRLKNKFKFATEAGDIGGDVLSIMAGRLPFARRLNAADAFLANKKFATALADPSALRTVQRALDSKAVRSLMRGSGRLIETGTEAGILAALRDADPLEAAAYGAGSQAIGSALINAGQGIFTGGPLKIGGKLLLASASFGALVQMTKETIPGGTDNPLEVIASFGDGFEKVQFMIALGAISAVAGAGRLRGEKLEAELPKITDAIATIPRGISLSLLTDYMEASPDEQQTIDATLQQLQQDPEFFGPEITKKLLKAFESGNLTEALRNP